MSLLLGGIGPQEECEVFAGARGLLVKDEVSEERLQARGMDGKQRLTAKLETEATQQTNAQDRH